MRDKKEEKRTKGGESSKEGKGKRRYGREEKKEERGLFDFVKEEKFLPGSMVTLVLLLFIFA